MDLSVQPDASLVRYVEVGLIRSYRDIRPIADATYLIGRVLIWIWPTLVDYQSFQHLATSTFIAMTLDGRYLRLLTCPLRSSLQHAERSFSVFLVVVVAQRDKSRATALPLLSIAGLRVHRRNSESQCLPNAFKNTHFLRQWDSIYCPDPTRQIKGG